MKVFLDPQRPCEAAARLVLKDARLGKKAHAAGRIADLHAALKEAKSAGLAAEELQGAREVLDELVAEVKSRLVGLYMVYIWFINDI